MMTMIDQSNHIMIVVDLRSGTYYQKCYDPDCQALDYRSPEYALPPDICPTVFTLPNSVSPPGVAIRSQPYAHCVPVYSERKQWAIATDRGEAVL